MTLQEIIDEVEGDTIADRANLVACLKPYIESRDKRDYHAKEVDLLGKTIKAYLERTGEELWDGEAEIVGKLQTRNGSESYDVFNMPPELVLKLQQANALSVDLKVLKALVGKSALPEDVKRWKIPGGQTTALIVQKGK